MTGCDVRYEVTVLGVRGEKQHDTARGRTTSSGKCYLLLGLNLTDAGQEVFVGELCGFTSKSKHAGLYAHSLELSTIEVFARAGELLEVDTVKVDIHLIRVYPKDLGTTVFIREGELDFAI